MSEKYERLLDQLAQSDGWVTATELADRMGVTTRSVRSYVQAAKTAAEPLEPISSGPQGYRINREALVEFRAGSAPVEHDTPRDRLYTLVRLLGTARRGVELHSVAAELYVSESTVENDLRKIKQLAEAEGLALARRGSQISLEGEEVGYRRLLSRMFRDESSQGFLDLDRVQREFDSPNLSEFKTDLIRMIDDHGFFVNEYGINNVLLHLAIALERTEHLARLSPATDSTRRTRSSDPTAAGNITEIAAAAAPNGTAVGEGIDQISLGEDATIAEFTAALDRLVLDHFGVSLAIADLNYLSVQLMTRVVTPGLELGTKAVVDKYVDTADLTIVRQIVEQIRDEYLIDLDNEDFMVRLSLHVRNLIARAQDRTYSPNPMTRSMKTSYPMTYELAVFIASQLQRSKNIVVNDDEIAYIALHVGSYLEGKERRTDLLTCAIVCPNYYDMHLKLVQRIEQSLGDELDVTAVITRTDTDWAALDVDLVLTTLASRSPRDNEVLIQPFLTSDDIDTIRKAISKSHRQKRRQQLKSELLKYFNADLFFRNLHAASEIEMIRRLGDSMIDKGIIDEGYVAGAIDRELMSSTAFTDSIAVPHAMAMTASTTSIAIVLNDAAMPWGDNRVNVIALIAFAADGRKSFQGVFDQFVEVFSDRTDVQRILKQSVDFSSFIEELVRVMDS
jgi:lichenan operon transcriptional antiterminator